MKKSIAILMLVLFCFLVGCGGSGKGKDSSGSDSTVNTASQTSSTADSSSSATGSDAASVDTAANVSSATSNVPDKSSTVSETSKETKTDPEQGQESASNTYEYDHLSFVLPEGFSVIESGGIYIAVPSDYPARTDNITFSKSAADSIAGYSQQTLEDYFNVIFNGTVESINFEKIKIDGTDAIRYSYKLSVSGVNQAQTMYTIFGNTYTDVITFTSVSGDFDAEFEKSAKTIKII